MKKTIALALWIFIYTHSHAQYTNLVLEGGGMKGLAYSGAIEVLDSLSITPQIQRIAGTSSGAMNGLLLAIGYTGKEITYLNIKTNFGKYNQVGIPVISGIFRLRNHYGYYKTDRFMEDLAIAMQAKGFDSETTFMDLHQKRLSHSNLKDLFITGTNLTDQKLEVFSYLTYPSMKIIDAVKISISIPFYFEAIFMQPDGSIIQKKEATDETKIMTDGGIVDNYPFHIFDSLAYVNNQEYSYYVCNDKTLGLKLEIDSSQQQLSPQKITRQNQFMSSFSHLSSETRNRRFLGKQQLEQTIFINTQGFNPKIRRISKSDKVKIIKCGYSATLKYFETKNLLLDR